MDLHSVLVLYGGPGLLESVLKFAESLEDLEILGLYLGPCLGESGFGSPVVLEESCRPVFEEDIGVVVEG